MSIRVLSHRDVHRLLPPEQCAAAMREALTALAAGRIHQPDRRPVLDPPGAAGLLGLMPAYLAGDEPAYGLKAVTLFPGNTARGLDSHQGAVLLFDGSTGRARALLDASAVTEVRSAAVTAVATDLLARRDARVLAVVGTGVQGRAHVRALAGVRGFERIRVAARDAAKTRRVCAELAAELGRPVEPCSSVREAVTGADVVVTATDAAEPVLRREWLAPGCHVNAVGSAVATTRELDGATMAACDVFCDSVAAVRAEAGDYLLALREGAVGPDLLRASLGEVLTGAAAGRSGPERLTLFESVGLAAWDLVAALHAVARAERLGAGSVVPY
ncbi:ornithine cyclodeaminase family protein [Kitasatospora sp. NRRL B-11411]|uniref:ornithine cyclodeaminase family protein n=1 Tax=Kitasatospora sp. NRRL B-11411 TaxID=1463822 RepID=UPI00055BA74C|nr:ornithine cyclodeaminase family protein [Kitasatospora sp. NRRL B-11411]